MLERTIAALRDVGVLVLADAKRGDIGSTMAAYAQAWAGTRRWPLTRSPPRRIWGSVRCSRCWTPRATATAGFSCWPRRPTRKARRCSARRLAGGTVAQSIVDAAAAVNGAGPARLGRRGRRRDADRRRPTSVRSTARCWCPGWAPRAGGPKRWRASAERCPASFCPRSRGTCCGPDRTSRSLRAAAERMRDAVAYLASRPLDGRSAADAPRSDAGSRRASLGRSAVPALPRPPRHARNAVTSENFSLFRRPGGCSGCR